MAQPRGQHNSPRRGPARRETGSRGRIAKQAQLPGNAVEAHEEVGDPAQDGFEAVGEEVEANGGVAPLDHDLKGLIGHAERPIAADDAANGGLDSLDGCVVAETLGRKSIVASRNGPTSRRYTASMRIAAVLATSLRAPPPLRAGRARSRGNGRLHRSRASTITSHTLSPRSTLRVSSTRYLGGPDIKSP